MTTSFADRPAPPARLAAATTALALLALIVGGSGAARAGESSEPSTSLAVEGAYDSNIYNGRGPDWVTRITPHLGWVLRDRRMKLDIEWDGSYWIYAEGKANNSFNQRAAVSLQEQVTRRLNLRVADEFIRAEDPAFLTRAGVIAPQTGITDNLAEAALAYRITRRLDLVTDYAYHMTRFDQPPPPTPQPIDGDQHDFRLGLLWKVGHRDELRAIDHAQYFTIDADALAFTEGASLGWTHQFFRELELKLEAGPLWFEGFDRARSIPEAFTGSAISWRGDGTLRFVRGPYRAAIVAVRDFVGGTGAGSVLWAEWIGGSFGVKPMETMDLRLALSYFANGYAPNEPTLYDGVSLDAAADFRVAENFDVGAFYSLRIQRAHGVAAAGIDDVTRHIAGARIRLIFGAEARPVRREVHE